MPRLIWMLFANPDTSTVYGNVAIPAGSGLFATRTAERSMISFTAPANPDNVAAGHGCGHGGIRRPTARPKRPWHEGFEGPIPSWHEAGGDAQYAIQQHRRVPGIAHSGQGCEWFQIAGQGGSTVYVAHDVGRPWVIDDLRPSVWVKSDRGGLQFLADVVLPRTARSAHRPAADHVPAGAHLYRRGPLAAAPHRGPPAACSTRQLQHLAKPVLADVDGREAYVTACC